MMKLTAHFTLEELTASVTAQERGLNNTPPQEFLPRLILVAQMLERIRVVLAAPIVVSSGYRSPEVNRAVGSKDTSDHPKGHAADFWAPQYGTPTAIAARLAPMREELGIGQLILEGIRGKQWVHVSTQLPEKPINQVLTITDAGPQPGIHQLA